MNITSVTVQYAYDLNGGGVHYDEVAFVVTMEDGHVYFWYKKVGKRIAKWLTTWLDSGREDA